MMTTSSKHYIINLRRDDGELITDQINMVVIELRKLRKILKKPVNEMTSLDMWSVFFRYADDPKYRKLINEIMEKKEVLAVAGEALITISNDERERAKQRSRRMFETDMVSNLLTAEKRGEKKGRRKGLQEGRQKGQKEADKKWQDVVANKDAALAEQTAALVEQTAALAEQAEEIARLKARLGEGNKTSQ